MTDASRFVLTKEHTRFAEFCDACRRYRYIGLCYGQPGVGKTLSARHYAVWDHVEKANSEAAATRRNDPRPPLKSLQPVLNCRTVFFTPKITNSALIINSQLHSVRTALGRRIEEFHERWGEELPRRLPREYTELIIIDEADRLKVPTLEQLRAIYDEDRLGLVLIGMPGIEKKLSRYAQLYSRVGFVHQFRTLTGEELQSIIEHRCRELFPAVDKPDAEAIGTIGRITGGNFRLMERLFDQIQRIVEINELDCISADLVQAARETLVIGVS